MDWLVAIAAQLLVMVLVYGYGYRRRPVSPERQRWISRTAVVLAFFVAGPASIPIMGGTLTEGILWGGQLAFIGFVSLVIFALVEQASVWIWSRVRRREEL